MGTIFREDVVAMLPKLRACARGLALGDRSLADDLVQDTVLLALRAQAQFRPGTNLEAWLFTILRNRFRSLVGHRRQRAEVVLDDGEELERVLWVPAFQEVALDVRAFRLAFARLKPGYREVLVLHAVHGFKYERIAAVCGCEVGTVKSRMNRARAELKAVLLGEDAPGERPGRRARARREPRRPGRGLTRATQRDRQPGRATMGDDWGERVRERAYAIWEREGRPEGGESGSPAAADAPGLAEEEAGIGPDTRSTGGMAP